MLAIHCDDSSLNSILVIVQNILLIIQIAVPIILLVFATIQFIKLVKNPEEKSGVKKIIHSFLAAAVIFFIPMLVNVVMGMLGDGNDISKCWNANVEIGKPSYIKMNSEKNRKKFISDASDYEKGSSASEFCPRKVSRTRTGFNNVVLEATHNVVIDTMQNIEANSSYTTQSAVYDCQNIIVGQHRKFTINGVKHRNEGGRVSWLDIATGKNVANVAVGAEGIHMDRLAYDSDRDVILVGSSDSENMLQIDNKTKQIMGEKYTSMYGGKSRFIKYDSQHHQLVGLEGKVISYYQYNESHNVYVKTGSINLEVSTRWDPQNFNVDGQVIYIANSNPGWHRADYAVITFDMKTGKMVEYHEIGNSANDSHIEDVIVDMEGNLWLINVGLIHKVSNYVGNAFAIGS